MSSFITHWITTGGIVLVFVLMAAESCGIPFPSEVIMPFAGFFAAQGHITLTGSIIAGTLGNVAGSLVAYGLAARFGRPLLLGPGRRIGIRASHLDLADRWFERHGLTAVLVGRVLPVVRTYISFPAGLARVELVRFTLLTAVGALPWCIALAAAGYAIGANYSRVSGPIEVAAIIIAVIVVAIVVAWFVRGRRRAAPGRER
ncbi:MAG TPA: DedA family protein [Candidatus Dormibacteraeota bacterium]|nr:DedA family protein [Candidatus Dormibacteraeota bacterium]